LPFEGGADKFLAPMTSDVDPRELDPVRIDHSHHWSAAIEVGTWITALAWAIFAILMLGFAGCDKFEMPSAAKTEAQAREAMQSGDHSRAVQTYEALLDGTPKTAAYHYQLALIYDDKLKDPVSALHHFRRFLRMSEDEARKKEVSEYVKRIELIIATRASDAGIVTKREAARLRNENLKLEETVRELREEITVLKRKPDPASAKASPSSKKPERDAQGFSTNPTTRAAEQKVGTETKTYTVQKGDTLASISRRFYNSPQRWKDIADANQNQLQGSVNLKVGQTLIIPK
jgi:nucleoid-associated protein YgaU